MLLVLVSLQNNGSKRHCTFDILGFAHVPVPGIESSPQQLSERNLAACSST